jgi:hypothetical protein
MAISKRQKKLNEIDDAEKKAKQLREEFNLLVKQQETERDIVQAQIDKLLEGKNLYCGAILTEEDILNAVKLKFGTKESIHIPYRLYIIEKPEEEKND